MKNVALELAICYDCKHKRRIDGILGPRTRFRERRSRMSMCAKAGTPGIFFIPPACQKDEREDKVWERNVAAYRKHKECILRNRSTTLAA